MSIKKEVQAEVVALIKGIRSRNFLSHIPNPLSSVRKSNDKKISETVHNEIELFFALKMPNEEIREAFHKTLPNIVGYYTEFVRMNIVNNQIYSIIYWTIKISSLVLVYFIAHFIIDNFILINYFVYVPWFTTTSILLMTLFLIIVFITYEMLYQKYARTHVHVRSTFYIGIPCIIGLLCLFFFIIIYWLFDGFVYDAFYIGIMTGALLSAIYSMLLIILLRPIRSMLSFLNSRWRLSHYPLSIIIFDLLKILVVQENFEGKEFQTTKTSLEYKHIQLLLLEETARCIDYFLPHQLRSRDFETEAWFTKKAKRIATALRQKKRWILTPKSETYINFANSIVTTLSYISNGNWNSLEQIEPKMVPNPKLWKSSTQILVKVFRTVLLAVAPIVIFIVFQQIKLPPFPLEGAALAPAISLLFVYEINVIDSALDSKYRDKLPDLKPLFGSSSGSSES